MKIDKIVLHSAFTLSDEPYLIENVRITSQDKLLYICGHGNAEKQTIGGRYMREIANLLIEKGWTGQQIYLTSCDSNKQYESIYTIRHELNTLLKDRLITKVSKSRSRKNIIKTNVDIKNIPMKHFIFKNEEKNMKLIKNKHRLDKTEQNKKIIQLLTDQIEHNCFVYSDATGSTITIKNNEGESQIFILDFSTVSEIAVDVQNLLIDKRKTTLDSIEINEANLDYLKKQNKVYFEAMQKYKIDLLMKYSYRNKTISYKIREKIQTLKDECDHNKYMG